MKDFDFELLRELIEKQYIIVQKHPTAALYIYNYTPIVQFERYWNSVTMACRGLILDGQGTAVARPFPKFFNLEELTAEQIPKEPFDVFEKLDGSLGILYFLDNQAFIASRGSFTSEQAVRANQILQKKYAPILPHLNPEYTYLFEIIYPENRIVVQYGDQEDLVLTAIIETKTGKELPLQPFSAKLNMGFTTVAKLEGVKDLRDLKKLALPNKEGFVVRFKSGFRLKVKFEEYVRLHRILTGISSKNIWEYLKTGQSIEPLLADVPDEFYDWVHQTLDKLHLHYKQIEEEAQAEFKVLETRKETAFYFSTCKHYKILFFMLDGKDYSKIIWRMVEPAFEKPFRTSSDSTF
jgi:RNA ligase